jgi:hypothetical protein
MTLTKSQKVAQKTNEINKCAKIAGLSYGKFLRISKIALGQWQHMTMQDLAEEIKYNDIIDPENDTSEEIASFINDLWREVYV